MRVPGAAQCEAMRRKRGTPVRCRAKATGVAHLRGGAARCSASGTR